MRSLNDLSLCFGIVLCSKFGFEWAFLHSSLISLVGRLVFFLASSFAISLPWMSLWARPFRCMLVFFLGVGI